MKQFSEPIQNLIDLFKRLPGIGPKTAERFAFWFIRQPENVVWEFSENLQNIKKKITNCSQCHNFAQTDPCSLCTDSNRDHSTICVVAKPQDLLTIEKTNVFKGIYHVLGGNISPLEGISPAELKVAELIKRLSPEKIKEIILAFNPDLEGEATILYLTKLLEPKRIKITRLALGLPRGADLEYADEITMTDALRNRKEI